jgi:hypothetical protein
LLRRKYSRSDVRTESLGRMKRIGDEALMWGEMEATVADSIGVTTTLDGEGASETSAIEWST